MALRVSARTPHANGHHKVNVLNKLSFPVVLACVLTACVNQIPAPQKPPLAAGQYEFTKDYLSWMIQEEMKQNQITGLSIALVAGRETVWQSGFGLADKASGQRIETASLFRTGSIIKTLNAIAIMALVEQAHISLDDPITNHLPNFTIHSRFGVTDTISIRSLLTHHSGIPSDLIKGMWVENPNQFHDVMDYLSEVYVAQPADTVFTYSNLSHNVLAMLIEKVSGETYADFMAKLIEALGMTTARISAFPANPATVKAYENGRPRKELALRDIPAAGLTANVEDLAKIIAFFNYRNTAENSLLSIDNINTMLSDYSSHLPLNFGKRIGLGLFYFDGIMHRKIRIFGHGGASVNHRSLIKFAPDQQYGVVVLANSPNASPSLHRISNKALELLHEAKFGKTAPLQHRYWPPLSKIDITAEQDLIGHYATPVGLAKIYRHKNKLKARLAGRSLDLYKRKPDGFYYLKYKLFGLFPIKIGYAGNLGIALREVRGKKILIGVNTVGNISLLGEKITPREINATWQARVGRYRAVTPLEVMDLPSGGIKIKEAFLVAYAKTEKGNKLEVVLQPISENEAVVAGIGRGLGETVFVEEKHNKEILKYSNIVFEKIN